MRPLRRWFLLLTYLMWMLTMPSSVLKETDVFFWWFTLCPLLFSCWLGGNECWRNHPWVKRIGIGFGFATSGNVLSLLIRYPDVLPSPAIAFLYLWFVSFWVCVLIVLIGEVVDWYRFRYPPLPLPLPPSIVTTAWKEARQWYPDTQTCMICLETLEDEDKVVLLQPWCQHTLHATCFQKAYERKPECPYCRAVIPERIEVLVT